MINYTVPLDLFHDFRLRFQPAGRRKFKITAEAISFNFFNNRLWGLFKQRRVPYLKNVEA